MYDRISLAFLFRVVFVFVPKKESEKSMTPLLNLSKLPSGYA